MSKYWILAPCAYVANGAVIRHKRVPDAPVEIDDIVADFLGDKVRRVDPFKQPADAITYFATVDAVEEVPPVATEDDEEVADDVTESTDDADDEVALESPTPRRRRKKVDVFEDAAPEVEVSDGEG